MLIAPCLVESIQRSIRQGRETIDTSADLEPVAKQPVRAVVDPSSDSTVKSPRNHRQAWHDIASSRHDTRDRCPPRKRVHAKRRRDKASLTIPTSFPPRTGTPNAPTASSVRRDCRRSRDRGVHSGLGAPNRRGHDGDPVRGRIDPRAVAVRTRVPPRNVAPHRRNLGRNDGRPRPVAEHMSWSVGGGSARARRPWPAPGSVAASPPPGTSRRGPGWRGCASHCMPRTGVGRTRAAAYRTSEAPERHAQRTGASRCTARTGFDGVAGGRFPRRCNWSVLARVQRVFDSHLSLRDSRHEPSDGLPDTLRRRLDFAVADMCVSQRHVRAPVAQQTRYDRERNVLHDGVRGDRVTLIQVPE